MSDYTISITGASKTCNHCGTIFDLHRVDIEDCIPQIGDGCEHCCPENPDDEDFLLDNEEA